MQEGVVAEQQDFMGTKKARVKKLQQLVEQTTLHMAVSRNIWVMCTNTKSKMLLLQAGHVSS